MAASFSETRTKIQRCKVKALIIAITKKSQYCPGEQQEKKKDLNKAKKIIKIKRNYQGSKTFNSKK